MAEMGNKPPAYNMNENYNHKTNTFTPLLLRRGRNKGNYIIIGLIQFYKYLRTVLCKVIFFITLAIVLIIPITAISSSPVDKNTVAPASTVSVLDKVNQKTAAPVPSSPKDTTQIVVNIIVNSQSKGDFFVEMDEGKNLFVRVEDIKTLKLKYAEDKALLINDEQYVPLSALPDVSCTFDEKKLAIAIIGKTMEAGETTAELFSLKPVSQQNIYYPRETSAFINYGLTYGYTNTDGFQSFAVTNKVGFRTGDVFFTSDSLYTKTETSDDFVRLQSSATYERRGDLQWLVMGDQYANSGELGSTVNIGGIGFSKVYKIDPYFITQPVMDLKGSVMFPTQAEIYMDGVLIGKQSITPGSFDLKNLYSYTGSHNVVVLLRDPFGNVQKIDSLAYFSTQMLREGLQEYSYNVGVLRDNYGVDSNQYGKPAFSMFHRYGVTNNFNIGVRAEGADGVYNGGLSTAFLIPMAGQLSLSIAGSSASGNDVGGAVSLQHSYQRGSFNTNVLLRGYSRDYETVGSSLLTDATQYEMNLGMGLLINPLGSFSVNYSENEMFSGLDTRVISANYSRVLYKTISLFVTASATHTSSGTLSSTISSTTNSTIYGTNYSLFAGLNFDFGKGIHGSTQVSAGSSDVNTETMQVQKDVPLGEGVGYRATLNRSETATSTITSLDPYVQYNAKYGIYSIDATMQNTQAKTSELYNLSAAGSLVYAGGFYGLSRPVSDSFGIVMVNDVPGATILTNGQEIGKTGSSGTMIVPTLTSYSQNKITLDTKDIPIDYSISDINRTLSPSLWSGSCISFYVQQVRALTGTLVVQKEGKKTPLEYVEISVKTGEKILTYPTGKGGEFYIENILPKDQKEGVADQKENTADNLSCHAIAEQRKSGGNEIKPGTYPASVEVDGGKCEFTITFPDTKEPITDLGEIPCVAPQSSMPPPVPASSVKETPPVAAPLPSIQTQPRESVLPGNKLHNEKDEEVRRRPSPPTVESPQQVSETTPVPAPLPALKSISSTSAVEQKQEKVSFILRAQFVKGKSFLDKKHDKYVKKLADFMKAHPETGIEIIGHTDNTGKESVNMMLSQRRANSVRKYLIDKFGIDASRINALGYGSNEPIASNKTKEGRRKNNRVEVVIEGLQIK